MSFVFKKKKGNKRKNILLRKEDEDMEIEQEANHVVLSMKYGKKQGSSNKLHDNYADDGEEGSTETFKLKRKRGKSSKGKMIQAPSTMMANERNERKPLLKQTSSNKYSKEALRKLMDEQNIYVAPSTTQEKEIQEPNNIEGYGRMFNTSSSSSDNMNASKHDELDPMVKVQVERAKRKRQLARESEDMIPLSFNYDNQGSSSSNKKDQIRKAVNDITRDIAMNQSVFEGDNETDAWEMEMLRRGGSTKDMKRVQQGISRSSVYNSNDTTPVEIIDWSKRLSIKHITSCLSAKKHDVEEDLKTTRRQANNLETTLETLKHDVNDITSKVEAAMKKQQYFSGLRDTMEDISGCLTAKRSMIKEVEQAMFKARSEAFSLLHKEHSNSNTLSRNGNVEKIIQSLQKRLSEIREGSKLVFEDVHPELTNSIFTRETFDTWANLYPSEYKTAYAAMSLPDFVELYARLEMCVLWDPVNQSGVEDFSSSLDQFEWYNIFFSYGENNEAAVIGSEGDEQVKDVIPEMIKRVILPLCEEHIRASWSPLITHETIALARTLEELLIYDPPKESMVSLMKVMLKRIEEIQEQLSLPLDRDNPIHVTFVENIEIVEQYIPKQLMNRLAI